MSTLKNKKVRILVITLVMVLVFAAGCQNSQPAAPTPEPAPPVTTPAPTPELEATTPAPEPDVTTPAEITGDYTNPVVPEGYTHVEGGWNDGFVIQDEAGNQFVWVPVGSLKANGSFGGSDFDSQFGRRNFANMDWSLWSEPLDEGIQKQQESVNNYGGFYIARYEISFGYNINPSSPFSVKQSFPIGEISWQQAVDYGQQLGQSDISSHLLYGSEFDSCIEWFLETGTSSALLFEDSRSIGNYSDEPAPTGFYSEFQVNRIYDMAGNYAEWTQEIKTGKDSTFVARGGSYGLVNMTYIAVRGSYPSEVTDGLGLRVALYIP